MRLRNREGTPVDPWPFLVVAGCGVLPLLAFGPPYLIALGVPLGPAMATCGVASAAVVAGAYRRYVRDRHPERWVEVPAERRLRRLLYGALLLFGVLALLALPLVGRYL